jgi:hypothetical protein
MSRIVALALAGVLAMTVAVGTVSAAPAGVLTARPQTIDFGTRTVGTDYFKRTKITNTSGSDVVLLVLDALPDDFGFGLEPGSTCPVLAPATLAAKESCYAVVRFTPSEFFVGWRQPGSLTATATDPTTGAILAVLTIPVWGTGSL